MWGPRIAAACLCVLTPVLLSVAAPARAEDTVSYTVHKGDSLYALGQRYMERRDDWRIVQRLNHIGNPHRIPPGTRLTIPTRLLKGEPLAARVIAFKGAGTLTPAAGPGAPLARGMAVLPGALIETGASSFATLELSNGSRIALPSNTRVRVRAMRRLLLTGSVDFDFLVEQGRIETSVAPLKGAGDSYRIRTPIATAAVRGTNFRVGYEGGDAPSLTEVTEGTVGLAARKATSDMPIEQGFGASASATGKLEKEALLPPPELIEPGKVHTDPLVILRLSAISGARGYHVQIARDAGFVELEREATSPTPELSFADIPNGRWFVRATGIAASGLEGMPQSYAVRRVLAGISASAKQGADGWRFAWSGGGSGKRRYHFILRPERANASPLVDEPGLEADSITLSDLPPGAYVWRVGLTQYDGGDSVTNWLPPQRLIVSPDTTGKP